VVFSRLALENTGLKDNLGEVDFDVDEQGGLESGGVGDVQALITVYEACWISDYSVSYASDTALVQETVTINVSDILSHEPFSAYQDVEDYDVLATGEAGVSQRVVS
jgi:hypothetical protein